MYQAAINAGALAGKLLGAGAGGFLMLFAHKEDHAAIELALGGYKRCYFSMEEDGAKVIYNDERSTNYKDYDFSVNGYIKKRRVLSILDQHSLEAAIKVVEDAFNRGAKIITCGNGGSASTASHYITDWTKMVNLATGEKLRGLPC